MYNNTINFSIKINLFKTFAGYKQIIKIKFGAKFYKREVSAVINYLNNLKKIRVKFEIKFN